MYETGTQAGKRVPGRLGGAKTPYMVVLPDADLDLAADAAVSAGFGMRGERCMAISAPGRRGTSVGDELVAKIKERVAKLTIGPGADRRSEMGPLVTGAHRDKVASTWTPACSRRARAGDRRAGAPGGRAARRREPNADGFGSGRRCSTT